ncbi:hypothetical protein Leryth_021164, partial [Lithospermum erythrorhizon]
MSAFLRLMRGVHVVSSPIPGCSPVILEGLRNSVGFSRRFGQPVRQEEEEEEVEIDPRRLPADYDPATFDPSQHRSPPTERVWRLVDEISSLTLVEITELSSIMMAKMGMKEPPTIGVMKPGAVGMVAGSVKGAAASKEEKKPRVNTSILSSVE